MANELRFDGKVAIVTGAGNGLGRAHALLLGSRGAKIVVNDLGGGRHGGGKSSEAADKVVAEIKAAGGEAVANYDSVEEGGKIVQSALDAFGRIDIVVNNAGILRDTSFPKMTEEDWELIYRVHVLGAFRVTHAAWPHMRDQGYGRVIFTSSAAGIYGNFGQANYAMAKLGLVGLSNTLALEGKKKNVLVNTIAPIAGSRMTETVLPKEIIDALKPEYVSPLVAYLCHESCTETGGLFEVGGGFFAKLRWERSKGKTFRLGKNIRIEDLERQWNSIAGFEQSTHPPDINESMAPVLTNVQAGPAKGGNDLIDVDQALGYEYPPIHSSYEEHDLALYALGVGAAEDPLDDKDLRHVYELHGGGFVPLPTYGVIPALKALMDLMRQGKMAPGMNYGLDRLLHGEQYMELKRPLPPAAKLTHKARIKEIWDKGKNAVIVTEIRSFDESGEELVRNESSAVIRGAGGWGGERGPATDVNVAPERAADATIEQKIPENQALLYRLSGDWNPLHADPGFASAFGFQKPILHGLCTFGYAARHVVRAFAGNDARKFKSIKARFAESVFPGETLMTEMWKESETRIVFRCRVKERDKVVISNAAIELFTEIPQALPKAGAQAPAQASAQAAPAASGPTDRPSADVFIGIADYVAKNPNLVDKVKTVYQFNLTSPNSTWTLDLKNGKGSVFEGAGTAAPDCTLEIDDADWLAMASGAADPQQLYFGGKLKISGNVMASQKLSFMKKIDPEQAKAAIAAHKAMALGSNSTPAASPAASPAKAESASGDVFIGIRDYVEKNPALIEKVKTVFQFKLTNPDATWTLDLKNGKGAVFEGAGKDSPDCTLEIEDADWLAMASGAADPQQLYFGGKLKISGNVMASQKLSFMKKIDPEQAKAAVTAHKAKGASGGGAEAKAAPAAQAASSGPGAAAVFDALKERLGKSPEIAKELGAVVGFKLSAPAGEWFVDFSEGKTAVQAGAAPKAAAVLSLSTEDLVLLAQGKETEARLYQTGRMRVDGDVRIASHRLGFLKGLLS
jgi:3-hydroxyacyl-CoA dehydrogenase/3a,7a,12a-trihydroxy-5b-cholest-24-enoyl-CoA hydratase